MKERSVLVTNITSLTQKMSQGIANLKSEKNMMKQIENTILLLDVSGSMSEIIDGKRKIDHLRDVVKDYPTLRKISFSDTIYDGTIPDPNSSTRMDLGFNYIKQFNPKNVIVISDGLPDSEEAALNAARSLNCPINVIYIGPPGDRGEEFMKLLCQMTGGRQVTVDPNSNNVDFNNQLKDKIVLMLPSG